MALSYPTIQKKKTYTAPTSSGSGNTLASMTNPYEYNPGGSGEQAGAGGGTVQPQSYVGGQVQNRNSLSSLPENLANTYQNTLAGMLSGDAYSPYKTSQFQGMNKSAQQIRANAQQANVGRAGQGTAIANKNATEAGIAQMAGETALSALQGEQEMKERGIAAANTLASMNESVRSNDINQGMTVDQQYGYIDPITGQRIRGSNELAGTQVDIQQQQANTQRDLGYAQIASSEKISQNQLNESARQFNITNQTDKDQFEATMKLNYDQLSEQQKQFLMNYGLDEAKFNQAKTEFTQNVALEEKKLASNEKIATEQLGLDAQKLAESARQFNISTSEAASEFIQKLNFDYASLSQDETQFLATLGLDQEKFEESKRQYNNTTALEDKWRTKDLDLKEQEIANQASQFDSKLSWDKEATTLGLDDAAKNRIWQASQNDKALQNAINVQQMILTNDQWKQTQIDELTRAGWKIEDARANADRQQNLTIANMQNSLAREIESGRITQAQAELAQQASQFTTQQAWAEKAAQMGIEQENAKMAWTTQERLGAEAFTASQATFQAQLQKEVTQMGLSVEEAKLLENRRQFESKSMFDTYCFEQGLAQADADRLWKTNERIAENINNVNMQTLQNKFTEKRWNFEATYNYIQSLHPLNAAKMIQDMAESAGITHTVIDEKTGQSIEVPGFENFSQKAYDTNKSLNANFADGVIPNQNVSKTEVGNLILGWDTYVEKYPNLFVSADQGLESFSTVSWNKNSDSWKISNEGNTWLNNNVGKLVKGANGSVYQVAGKGGSTDRNGTSYIMLRDITTGNIVKYSSGSGGSQKFNYVQ